MNIENNMINRISKELLEYDKLGIKEIRNSAYQDFAPFFKNKNELNISLDYNILVSEYIFFVKHFKDSIFELFLFEMIDLCNKSIEINEKETLSFLETWRVNISKAIRSSAQVSHLERYKREIKRLDLYAKVTFTEIGDIVEGVLKHYVKFLYGFYLIVTNDKNIISNVEKTNLGTCIDALSNYNENFKIIYKECLKSVSLNQWRNIANHSDFNIDHENNIIIAHYGSMNSKNKIELTRNDLGSIAYAIFAIAYLHKIAITIVYIDNTFKSDLEVPALAVIEDTLLMHIVEVAYIEGFKAVDFERKLSTWKFEFYDKNNASDETILDQRINNIITRISKSIFIYEIELTLIFRGNIEKEVTINPPN